MHCICDYESLRLHLLYTFQCLQLCESIALKCKLAVDVILQYLLWRLMLLLRQIIVLVVKLLQDNKREKDDQQHSLSFAFSCAYVHWCAFSVEIRGNITMVKREPTKQSVGHDFWTGIHGMANNSQCHHRLVEHHCIREYNSNNNNHSNCSVQRCLNDFSNLHLNFCRNCSFLHDWIRRSQDPSQKQKVDKRGGWGGGDRTGTSGQWPLLPMPLCVTRACSGAQQIPGLRHSERQGSGHRCQTALDIRATGWVFQRKMFIQSGLRCSIKTRKNIPWRTDNFKRLSMWKITFEYVSIQFCKKKKIKLNIICFSFNLNAKSLD